MGKLTRIGIFLLLSLLLSPGMVLVFHEHEAHIHQTGSGNNFPHFDERCLVCEFEFSVFNSKCKIQSQQKHIFTGTAFPDFFESIVLIRHPYIYSLRAPPSA